MVRTCSICGKQLIPQTTGNTRLSVLEFRFHKAEFVYPYGLPDVYYLCAECADKVKEGIENGKSNNHALDY